jgi:transposase
LKSQKKKLHKKGMDNLPNLINLSHEEKDEIIIKLWEENQRLGQELEAVKASIGKVRVKKTSKNSSNPPSKDQKSNKSSTEKKPRKARIEGNNGRSLESNPDQIVVARAKSCPHCGEAVDSQVLHAKYDKIEIPPIKPIVTQVSQYGGHCPHCHKDYVSAVPNGLESTTPFGSSVETLATYLRYNHAISYNRLSNLFREMYHLEISEGGLANLFKRVNKRLEPQVEEILSRLRSSRVVCSDETSARVNGKTQWEWVFQNEAVCIHVIRPSRGQKVIEEVMGGHKPEIWVSDLFSAQKNHPAEKWQVCLAHQLRDCKYAIEAGDELFAPKMKRLLLRAFAVHRRRSRLKENTLYQYRCDLKRRLEQCLELEPTHNDGVRLKKRYSKIRDNLFLFLEEAAVPPTNNGSEQAIRMSTIFRKVTNCFRSDWGKDLFANVRSIVNTGKRQGLSAFQAIQQAISSPIQSFFFNGGG